ncbi:MAG: hypothetical protein QHD01_25945 [Bradyrhizobium sp.]|uniref:hypothetical protein n=1 Tax=Bradyrhizobium sp. TaxID=376 RepID=UPI0029AF4772|nr:hypothetical protein [Bradyrhizobium sp.]MDX3970020.1 hypothetical protein [Bradyrhizobium sp.]
MPRPKESRAETETGDGKFDAQREIAVAQDALLDGKMGACSAHLNKVMQATMVK